jgi:glutathione S-transferase
MTEEEIESALAAAMRGITAIGERLARDLEERTALVGALQSVADRVAALEERMASLEQIVRSMRQLQ